MRAVCVSILFIILAETSPGLSAPKSIPLIDALIPRLQAEEWSHDELSCRDATLRILYGVKNDTLWATWVWDSMQPPMGIFYGSGLNLGSFDQCLDTPWSFDEFRTQYCLVEVAVEEPRAPREFGPHDSADEYLNTKTRDGRIFNQLGFGVCMPASCSPKSVGKVFSHLLQFSHVPGGAITVDPGNCQDATPKSVPGGFHTFSCVIAALSVITIVSTLYSHFNYKKSTTIDSFTNSFCLTKNWRDLFKINKSEIRTLNGIRFTTAALVVVLHQGMLMVFSPSMVTNSLTIDEVLKTNWGKTIAHGEVIVDTFFALSGLLLMKSLMAGRQKNLLLVLVKRYIRLIGPHAVMTFFVLTTMAHTGFGPIWPKSNKVPTEICKQHWWKNFFMIGSDIGTKCHGVGWYVTCDFHLAILGTILYWIYRRNRSLGITAFAGVSCALTMQLGIKAYRNNLPLIPFSNMHVLADIFKYSIMNDVYMMWHDRAGAYFVGMAMGYLMTMYKPDDHRNVISKRLSFLILFCSLFVMYKVMSISAWLEESEMGVAAAVATNRIVWALALCALIGAFEYGSIPAISDFLGSSVYVPLSKLSYGLYMTHFYLVQRNLHAARSPLFYDIFNVIISVLGTTVLGCVASLILYLLVEAPLINISNEYFSEKSKKVESTSTKLTNGIYQNGNGKLKKS